MSLDTASQSFNTGPPQYAASDVTATIESVSPTPSGMDVTLKFTNTVQNGNGFFPSYTITATAGGQSKEKTADVFPGGPTTVTFSFSTVASVEIEANPGRNVESLLLSAGEPSVAQIQPPTATAEASPGAVTVTYSVENTGNGDGDVTVEITASGSTIETQTKTQSKTVPAGRSVSGTATFELGNSDSADVELCVALA